MRAVFLATLTERDFRDRPSDVALSMPPEAPEADSARVGFGMLPTLRRSRFVPTAKRRLVHASRPLRLAAGSSIKRTIARKMVGGALDKW
jgi:hypothetical protein